MLQKYYVPSGVSLRSGSAIVGKIAPQTRGGRGSYLRQQANAAKVHSAEWQSASARRACF